MAITYSLFSVMLLIFMLFAPYPYARGANYCGTSWSDASKCAVRCPSGKDFECGTTQSTQSCFADVICTSGNPSSPTYPTSPRPETHTASSNSNNNSTSSSNTPTKLSWDKSSILWEWLGPDIGAVSTIIVALIGVYCVKKKKAGAKQNDGAYNTGKITNNI